MQQAPERHLTLEGDLADVVALAQRGSDQLRIAGVGRCNAATPYRAHALVQRITRNHRRLLTVLSRDARSSHDAPLALRRSGRLATSARLNQPISAAATP